MRLYIIRHADPDYSIDGLTPRGELEAKALAKRMAKLAPDRLFVSPKGRAKATASYTEKALGKKSAVMEWLRERGEWQVQVKPWEPRAAWDLPGELIREKLPPPLYEDWEDLEPFRGKGFKEEYDKVKADSDAFLESLGYRREGGRYRILVPNREKIAVFCHNGLGITWLAHLLELPVVLVWSGVWLAPSSVTTILMEESSETWAIPRCIGLNDISHLYAEDLEMSPSGLKFNSE